MMPEKQAEKVVGDAKKQAEQAVKDAEKAAEKALQQGEKALNSALSEAKSLKDKVAAQLFGHQSPLDPAWLTQSDQIKDMQKSVQNLMDCHDHGGCSAANPLAPAVKNATNLLNPLAEDAKKAAQKAADALPDPHDLQKWAEKTGKAGSGLVKHVIDTAAKGARSAANMVPVP